MKKDWILGQIKTARKNYHCAICGGIITKGAKYDSHYHHEKLYDDSYAAYARIYKPDYYHLDCELPKNSLIGDLLDY